MEAIQGAIMGKKKGDLFQKVDSYYIYMHIPPVYYENRWSMGMGMCACKRLELKNKTKQNKRFFLKHIYDWITYSCK